MKRSRVIILASAGALVSTAVVGAAAFLTLGNSNADPLPEGAVWQNFLLPEPQINKHYGLAGLRDHMNLQLPHYGDPYTGISMSSRFGSGNIEDGSASSNPEVDQDNLQSPTRGRQLLAANFNRSFDNGGNGMNGGNNDGGRGGFQPTFPGLLSAMDAVRSELEDSIEPPFGPSKKSTQGDDDNENGDNNENDKDPLDDLVSNDDPMSPNPDPNNDVPPVDDQPLPEQEVPEPQSWALLLAGLFGLRLLRRRTA